MRDMHRAKVADCWPIPYEVCCNAHIRERLERPPLPFDSSMMSDMLLIPKSMRVRRIAFWWEHGCLSREQLNTLLAEHWGVGGWPADMRLGTRRLVRMFKDAGFVTDTEGMTAPTEPLTLYRGAGFHNINGLAWTTDERVAAWFARRLMRLFPESGPCLYSVTMPPQHILGRFLQMKEEEVVINALALRGRIPAMSGVYAEEPRVIALADEYNAYKAARWEQEQERIKQLPKQNVNMEEFYALYPDWPKD